jgi:hypothetical protein
VLSVLKRIEEQQAAYVKAPFFAFLRDRSIDVRQRMGFAPHVAHFVLTFADLCSLLLPQNPPVDRYQELVNANCREDQGHWRWFLSDLEQLGRNPQMSYSDAVRLIWSDATVRTRRLSYHLAHLALASDSLGKLVLVHCIEGAFQATAKDLEPTAQEFVATYGKPLNYHGMRHAEAEESHTLEDATIRRSVESIPLSPEQTERFCAMVDQSFALFKAFTDEMLDLSRQASIASS